MPEDLKKGDWGKNSLHQLWNNVIGGVGTNFYLGLLAKTAYHLNTSKVFFSLNEMCNISDGGIWSKFK